MKPMLDATGRQMMRAIQVLAGLTLALNLFAPDAGAQAQPGDTKPCESKPANPEVYRTFYLTSLTQQNELNDVLTDLRNMLPKAHVYGAPSQNSISMRGTPDDILLAEKIVSDLDRIRKVYRLTYTITESDGGKRIGARRYVLVVVSGERTVFKQGNRVPIVIGTVEAEGSAPSTQVQYQDVGLHIEASADGYPNGLRLRSKVEQSTFAEEKSGVGPQDPVLHQTVLDGASTLELGKPLILGSLDDPSGTRRQEVEVVAELVR